MKALEDQALEDESAYQEDEVIHIHFYELTIIFQCVSEVLFIQDVTCFKIHLRKILNFKLE